MATEKYDYTDFAIVHDNLKSVCENAYPVEAHIDEKPKDPNSVVNGAVTLVSALRSEDGDIPIRLTVKLFRNRAPTLHIAINNENRGLYVNEARVQNTAQRATVESSVIISVADFFRFVNGDAEFTKRVPVDKILNEDFLDMSSHSAILSNVSRLRIENDRLKKQVEYWKAQTKATGEWKADAKQESANAKSILKSVSSKANADDVTKRITKLHEDMSNGRLTYEQGKAEAVNIAADIVNKSSAMVSKDVESYNEAKRVFRSTPQVDVSYKQLQQMFGEDMFPRAITTREMLENINEYFDLVKPIAENPYDFDKALIIEDVANDIVDSGMEIQQAKPTVIDKERAKAAEAKDKAQRSAEEQKLVDAMYYGRLLAEERAKHKEALAKERGKTAEVKAQAKSDAKQQQQECVLRQSVCLLQARFSQNDDGTVQNHAEGWF